MPELTHVRGKKIICQNKGRFVANGAATAHVGKQTMQIDGELLDYKARIRCDVQHQFIEVMFDWKSYCQQYKMFVKK